jgi:iron complex transport system substrate-binding protein
MGNESSTDPTRRDVIKWGGGTVIGSTVLAGCLGGANSDESGQSTSESGTGSGGKETGTATSGPYSVSIEPMGKVTFDQVPETWIANNGSWGDMGVALGVGAPGAVWLPSRYPTHHYEGLPGVSVNKDNITQLYSDGLSKELFYELDADVHVMDPNFMTNRFKGLEKSDIEEIRTRIAPFFGNSIFSRGYPWHDYRYYTLYEAFEKLSQVFKRHDRYKAFKKLHDEFIGGIQKRLPPKSERPSVAVLWPHPAHKPETFSPYLIDKGTTYKHWRDLKVKDALKNSEVSTYHKSRGKIDYEVLLEVDPDVLLLQANEQLSRKEFRNKVLKFMKQHSAASKLTAVKNGDVYRSGGLYQGPIINLVLTERGAHQLYSDTFTKDELFDRKRVADIVNGK